MVYELGTNFEDTPEYGDQLYGLPLVPSGEVSEDLEHSEGFSSKSARQSFSFTGHIIGLGAAERTDLSTPDSPFFDM